MKYIDAEKLTTIIEERKAQQDQWIISYHDPINQGISHELTEILSIITSLQQEQPEDIVVIAKTFLDALSKTPYNNKPITDAQIIVRQLLLFFENPNEYNPNAILEQPEVDLEKEYKEYVEDDPVFSKLTNRNAGLVIACHFYELGLNARKEN